LPDLANGGSPLRARGPAGQFGLNGRPRKRLGAVRFRGLTGRPRRAIMRTLTRAFPCKGGRFGRIIQCDVPWSPLPYQSCCRRLRVGHMRRAARAPHSIVVPASICAAQRILPIIVAISTNATQIGTFPSGGQAALSLMLPRQFSFGPQRAPFGCDAIDRPRRRTARLRTRHRRCACFRTGSPIAAAV
jgi:hypothetical protein